MMSAAQPASAEIRALIVTVAQYTAPIPSLEGPPNDAAALKSVLEAQGAKDIVSLSDAQATRASIRAQLQALGQRAKPGDWVIFYYAGHGVQLPDPASGVEQNQSGVCLVEGELKQKIGHRAQRVLRHGQVHPE